MDGSQQKTSLHSARLLLPYISTELSFVKCQRAQSAYWRCPHGCLYNILNVMSSRQNTFPSPLSSLPHYNKCHTTVHTKVLGVFLDSCLFLHTQHHVHQNLPVIPSECVPILCSTRLSRQGVGPDCLGLNPRANSGLQSNLDKCIRFPICKVKITIASIS